MKRHYNILSLSVLSALSIITCQSSGSAFIKGEGEVVRHEITLDALNGINLGISDEVILTQGSPQKILLEGQQNIIDNIKHDVKNGVWNIYFDKSVRNSKPVIVHITLSSLDEVGISGSGSIRSTNKFSGSDKMDVSVAGSGNVTLDYTTSSTDLSLSGSGSANLSGESNDLSIAISGSGIVNTVNLISEDCEIHISGSGDAAVNATKTLEASISGSGEVQYKGSPSLNSHISGSGHVSKMN